MDADERTASRAAQRAWRGSALAVAGVALLGGVAGGGAVALLDRSGERAVTRVTTVSVPVLRQSSAGQPDAFTANDTPTRSINQIYRQDGPGVVSVRALASVADSTVVPGFSAPRQQARSQASGFVLDGDGYVLTNDHVVEGAKQVTVSFSNRDDVVAKVIGVDPSTDLALLKVDLPANALHPLALGDSDKVQVGDAVVAIGNPFGLDRTVTAGIVSAVQRRIEAPNGFPIANAIQTDAPINHGNSGGPLIDSRGAVVGIASQLPSNSGVNGNVGVGFAIPVNVAKRVIAQLRSTGSVAHAWLGFEGSDIDASLAQEARVAANHGVLVEAVVPGSPAAGAKLRTGSTGVVFNGKTYCLGGDVITKLDGHPVRSYDRFSSTIATLGPGERLRLTVAHADGTTSVLHITLGRQPDQLPPARSGCVG